MEKIVITGGLGYIGTELCKLYSGEARFKDITVIDNKFYSDRVRQLRDWGINFIQADILDVVKMDQILHDANVIYHLAGITDVAYTKTQGNEQKDKEIRDNGITGTLNIINCSPTTCKIIFPSTHVVFEGFKETKTGLSENEMPCPILTYSRGKLSSEIDLQNSALKYAQNYVILRLGSVYGYSGDATRMNIMPNLFSKLASQKNGKISLFSGGVQLKSLVSVIDVVRCMKFVAENKNINHEIFHVSNESLSVKEVALLCKEFSPMLNIVETEDEIPNLGYTISNKKLLATGFKFLYNIKDSIKEMIDSWSIKKLPTDLEYTITGGKEFIDERGKISNYELPEPINMIGFIESKQGSIRANHYHPIQEQKCLLVKGQYISVIKDLSEPNSPIEIRIINEGEIAVIKPNVAHTMVFIKDSIFLNLVRGEREHENYGVTHTIPYTLVDHHFALRLLANHAKECRICSATDLTKVVSLGISPLANDFKNDKDKDSCVKAPLQMDYCYNCHNCQLSYIVSPGALFNEYLYVSSTSASFRKHFEDAADTYIKEFHLTSESLVVDIGSNDGVFLKPLQEKGIKVVGIEPANNLAYIANQNGINTQCLYFENINPETFIRDFGKADLITASNVFAHSDKLTSIAFNAFEILKENGTFIIEVQYLLDTFKDMTFDNIYHEHVNYWSVISLTTFFCNLNLHVYKVEHINTHGGSIRAYIGRDGVEIDPSIDAFVKQEEEFGLFKSSTYKEFGEKVANIRNNARKNIALLKEKHKIIAGYGAPAKATTALNYFGIDCSCIDYVIEDNTLKHGKFIPGTGIPIVDKKYCLDHLPNVILVFAWNFFEEIKKSNQDLIDKGVIFKSIKDLYE